MNEWRRENAYVGNDWYRHQKDLSRLRHDMLAICEKRDRESKHNHHHIVADCLLDVCDIPVALLLPLDYDKRHNNKHENMLYGDFYEFSGLWCITARVVEESEHKNLLCECDQCIDQERSDESNFSLRDEFGAKLHKVWMDLDLGWLNWKFFLDYSDWLGHRVSWCVFWLV